MIDGSRRVVRGRRLVSDASPAITIDVDVEFAYVGRLEFTLRDLARVERFVFVEHDRRQIDRLVVVQFEGALPGRSVSYDFEIAHPIRLGGETYHQNTWVSSHAEEVARNPGGESDRTGGFLSERGLTHDDDLAMSRFARPVDDAHRHEIILFYIEAKRRFGLSVAEYAALSSERRAAVDDELLSRALATFLVTA